MKEKICEINQDVGIIKLGHQKKMGMLIKKFRAKNIPKQLPQTSKCQILASRDFTTFSQPHEAVKPRPSLLPRLPPSGGGKRRPVARVKANARSPGQPIEAPPMDVKDASTPTPIPIIYVDTSIKIEDDKISLPKKEKEQENTGEDEYEYKPIDKGSNR